jgi:hypothetical protein
MALSSPRTVSSSRIPSLAFFRLAQLGDDGEVFERGRVALDLAVGGQVPSAGGA